MVAFEEGDYVRVTGYILGYFNVTLHALLVYVHICMTSDTRTQSDNYSPPHMPISFYRLLI